MCVQLAPMIFHHPIALCLFYAYHFNIFVLSASNIWQTIKGMERFRGLAVLASATSAAVTAFLLCTALSFTGQGFRGLPKVFTQTSDRTLSRQVSPPSYEMSRERWMD
ncbi:MAG: hypothetical protein IKS17_06190 [Firmicutes bacterium]|nr:hypothetical protein [Bacillota bacterium]